MTLLPLIFMGQGAGRKQKFYLFKNRCRECKKKSIDYCNSFIFRWKRLYKTLHITILLWNILWHIFKINDKGGKTFCETYSAWFM